MKKKEIVELRQKTLGELEKLYGEKRQELIKLELEGSLLKLKNTASLKTLRKDIARMLTFIHEKKEGESYGKTV